MINNAIIENCKIKKNHVSIAWIIDYNRVQCASWMDTQMSSHVQDPPTTDNIHRVKYNIILLEPHQGPHRVNNKDTTPEYKGTQYHHYLLP